MEITLLYFDDCPSWQEADAHLRQLADEIPGLLIHRQLVETAAEAEQCEFRGSPSIHIDGDDLFARGDEPFGLSCRIYQTPDGPAGSPTLVQLRTAVERAASSGPQ